MHSLNRNVLGKLGEVISQLHFVDGATQLGLVWQRHVDLSGYVVVVDSNLTVNVLTATDPVLICVLLVRNDRTVWRWYRVIVDCSGTSINQLGIAWHISVNRPVNVQFQRTLRSSSRILAGSRNLSIGNRDGVLAGYIVAVFQHLGALVVNVLGKLGVVVRDGYLA